MESFLNRAALSGDQTIRDIATKISAINNRAVRLNEFMAYGLSNPTMRAELTKEKALNLPANPTKGYTDRIIKLIELILNTIAILSSAIDVASV
jgi:hypothetical protein